MDTATNWSFAAPWEEAEEKQLKGHTIHPASPGGWQSEIIPELLIRKMLFQVPAKVIRHAEARSQKIKRTLNIFFFFKPFCGEREESCLDLVHTGHADGAGLWSRM